MGSVIMFCHNVCGYLEKNIEELCRLIMHSVRTIHCKKFLVKMTMIAVTAVSGFIEQVGSMVMGIPKHKYHPSTPSQFHLASKNQHRHLSASQPISVHRQ